MRCSSCNTSTPGKTLKGTDWRCPNCGHQFVANKITDGLSDVTIKKAVEQVSDNSTLYYLSSHVAYHLCRRLSASRRNVRRACLVTAAVLAIGGVIVSLWVLKTWLFAVIGLALAGFFFLIARKLSIGTDLFDLVNRYETVNPPKRQVPATQQLVERE